MVRKTGSMVRASYSRGSSSSSSSSSGGGLRNPADVKAGIEAGKQTMDVQGQKTATSSEIKTYQETGVSTTEQRKMGVSWQQVGKSSLGTPIYERTINGQTERLASDRPPELEQRGYAVTQPRTLSQQLNVQSRPNEVPLQKQPEAKKTLISQKNVFNLTPKELLLSGAKARTDLKSKEQIEGERVIWEQDKPKWYSATPQGILKRVSEGLGLVKKPYEIERKSYVQQKTEPYTTKYQESERVGKISLKAKEIELKAEKIIPKIEEKQSQRIAQEQERINRKAELQVKYLQNEIDTGKISLSEAQGRLETFSMGLEKFTKSRERSLTRQAQTEANIELSGLGKEYEEYRTKLESTPLTAKKTESLFGKIVSVGDKAVATRVRIKELMGNINESKLSKESGLYKVAKISAKAGTLGSYAGETVSYMGAGAVANPLRTAEAIVTGAVLAPVIIPLATAGGVVGGVTTGVTLGLGGAYVVSSGLEVVSQPTGKMKKIKAGEIGAELVGFSAGGYVGTKAYPLLRKGALTFTGKGRGQLAIERLPDIKETDLSFTEPLKETKLKEYSKVVEKGEPIMPEEPDIVTRTTTITSPSGLEPTIKFTSEGKKISGSGIIKDNVQYATYKTTVKGLFKPKGEKFIIQQKIEPTTKLEKGLKEVPQNKELTTIEQQTKSLSKRLVEQEKRFIPKESLKVFSGEKLVLKQTGEIKTNKFLFPEIAESYEVGISKKGTSKDISKIEETYSKPDFSKYNSILSKEMKDAYPKFREQKISKELTPKELGRRTKIGLRKRGISKETTGKIIDIFEEQYYGESLMKLLKSGQTIKRKYKIPSEDKAEFKLNIESEYPLNFEKEIEILSSKAIHTPRKEPTLFKSGLGTKAELIQTIKETRSAKAIQPFKIKEEKLTQTAYQDELKQILEQTKETLSEKNIKSSIRFTNKESKPENILKELKRIEATRFDIQRGEKRIDVASLEQDILTESPAIIESEQLLTKRIDIKIRKEKLKPKAVLGLEEVKTKTKEMLKSKKGELALLYPPELVKKSEILPEERLSKISFERELSQKSEIKNRVSEIARERISRLNNKREIELYESMAKEIRPKTRVGLIPSMNNLTKTNLNIRTANLSTQITSPKMGNILANTNILKQSQLKDLTTVSSVNLTTVSSVKMPKVTTPPIEFGFTLPVIPFIPKGGFGDFGGGYSGSYRRKEPRTKDLLAYTESFTSRVLGLTPVKLTKKQARKLLYNPASGFEIRRGVIIE